jgi:ABC-type Fe3+ transport system permease subunit
MKIATLKKLTLGLTVLMLVAAPLLALAVPTEPDEDYQLNAELFKDKGPQGLLDIIKTVITWLFTILMILAVVFILFAAFTYLTSSGDEEKVRKAHNTLLYTAIAVLVGLLCYGIVNAVSVFVEESAR